MNEIEKNVDIFRKESNSEFRIRCPICGDSKKNPSDSHCYLKCSMSRNVRHRCIGRIGIYWLPLLASFLAL